MATCQVPSCSRTVDFAGMLCRDHFEKCTPQTRDRLIESRHLESCWGDREAAMKQALKEIAEAESPQAKLF